MLCVVGTLAACLAIWAGVVYCRRPRGSRARLRTYERHSPEDARRVPTGKGAACSK